MASHLEGRPVLDFNLCLATQILELVGPTPCRSPTEILNKIITDFNRLDHVQNQSRASLNDIGEEEDDDLEEGDANLVVEEQPAQQHHLSMLDTPPVPWGYNVIQNFNTPRSFRELGQHSDGDRFRSVQSSGLLGQPPLHNIPNFAMAPYPYFPQQTPAVPAPQVQYPTMAASDPRTFIPNPSASPQPPPYPLSRTSSNQSMPDWSAAAAAAANFASSGSEGAPLPNISTVPRLPDVPRQEYGQVANLQCQR